MKTYLWMLVIFISAADSQTTSWQLDGLEVTSSDGQVKFKLAQFDAAGYQLKGIEYSCPQALQIYPKHQCDNAFVTIDINGQTYQFKLNTIFNWSQGYWEVDLSSLNNQIKASINALSQVVSISLQNVELLDFFNEAPHWLRQLSGQLTGSLLADTSKLILYSHEPLSFNEFNYEHSDDVVFFGLGGNVHFEVDVINQKLTAQVHLSNGEMLLNELYVDYNSFPVVINISASLNDDFDYVIETQIINEPSMSLQAAVVLDQQFNWKVPTVEINVYDSHHFNQHILNSVLGIYGFGNTQMSGGFDVKLNFVGNNIQFAHVEFDDFYALNKRRKIQLDALNGLVFWDSEKNSEDSRLDWQSLLLAGMPINAGQMNFNVTKDEFKLLGKHEFSVFDGAIILQELAAAALFSEYIDMSMNATVMPISLKLITEKLNWPAMSGTISGELPGMVKRGSVIEFLGALKLSVFQGEMLVENLSLERLFGVAPVIAADVDFEAFDLALLTETFGFGQITGKLSGVVNDLRITNWKTDRLDAHIYTVKTKGVKQTISQRAIDNISSLGGIKGAISKTFLRFFDDFGYKRIELSCKLHNSVCQIGGIKNQDNQFVIVEGGGIPKINIVGFVRTINWEEFISRLLNANYDN